LHNLQHLIGQGSSWVAKFSTKISLYLGNDTRYRHSYNRKRICTRMRSIKGSSWV